MNTKEIIKLQNDIFSEVKNLWEISEKWNKSHSILDNFLDELNMKKIPENRFIAYSRISELRVEPLELYLDNKQKDIEKFNKKVWKKIPNKLQDKREVLNKAYNYVVRIYTDLQEKFIYELEKNNLVNDFELAIFKWVLDVWKAFNKFMPVWENYIIKQNEILDKKFDWNSEKIMQFLREKNLLELDERWQETDRAYSIIKAWKIISYFEAFSSEVNYIIVALQDFIEDLSSHLTSPEGDEYNNLPLLQERTGVRNYINYLTAINDAFLEKDCKKLLSKWQKVDEAWMKIKGPMQISHPLEFYEDKYRKAVAPEWDLRIIDTDTLDSKVKKNISEMYEKIYTSPLAPLITGEGNDSSLLKEEYKESYNFSKENFNRVQLYISEPVLYFWAELNWMFSAQVVPNDEVISEMYWKKIFAFPKMVLEGKKKAPLMRLTKEVLDEDLLDDYLKILESDKLFFEIYDVETIGHEFWHTLWLTKDTEVKMNKKTWNFKNIEEFKATTWGLVSYFINTSSQPSSLEENEQEQKNFPLLQGRGAGGEDSIFNKNILVMHLVRCIWLLKYREIVEILPYYNESLIYLEIMFETWIFEIAPHSNPLLWDEREQEDWYKIKLKFTNENFEKLKKNYIKHYMKLINIYLEKRDAWEFLFDYVVSNKKWNNISKNKDLRDFIEYYYDLYKKIGNEVI